MQIHDLLTPALLLDVDILERNLSRMQEKANRFALSLRPHIKTHKSPIIAKRQRALGAKGITVSTLFEAEHFATEGFDDITWALPVPLVAIDRALQLASRISFRLVVDSPSAVDVLQQRASAAQLRVHVFLKVDCGLHRAGVDPTDDRSVRLAGKIADSSALIFDGILTHAGHSYNASSPEEIVSIAAQERSVMIEFADKLRSAGIPVHAVSVGSTPTMTLTDDLTGITEIRPGNYCFYDLTMVSLGVCSPADCALTVLASVISSRPGTVLTDAGALALSKDIGAAHKNLGNGLGLIFRDYDQHVLWDAAEAVVAGVSQEHGKIRVNGPSQWDIGERIRILEQHSCLAAAMFDSYAVVRGNEVVDRWPVLRGRL